MARNGGIRAALFGVGLASLLTGLAGPTPAGAAGYRAYVAAYTGVSSSVTVIDIRTRSVIGSIALPVLPGRTYSGGYAVAVKPDGTEVYVLDMYGGVHVIDARTSAVVASIDLGGLVSTGNAAVTPDGTGLYVTAPSLSQVKVIDTATRAVVATIPVTVPWAVAVSPDGNRMYVGSGASPAAYFSVIDTATHAVTSVVSVGTEPIRGLTVSPDGRRLYLTIQNNSLDVFDAAPPHAFKARVPLGSANQVAVSPSGSRLYVSEGGGLVTIGSSRVYVLSADTTTDSYALLAGVPAGGLIGFGIAVTPDGRDVYMTNHYGDRDPVTGLYGLPQVKVLDTATNSVVASLTITSGYPDSPGQFISPNALPTVTLSGPAAAGEGDTATYSFTVDDENDTFALAPGFPTCGSGGTLVGAPALGAAGGSFQCRFASGPGSSTVRVRVLDSRGVESNTAAVAVTLQNLPPTLSTLAGLDSVDEGAVVEFTFTASDAGGDTLSAAAGFPDCGSAGTLVGAPTLGATGGSFRCRFPDGPAGPVVRMQVQDADGATSGVASLPVAVANVPPTYVPPPAALSSPQSPVSEGGVFTLALAAHTDVAADLASLQYAFDCGTGYGAYGAATSASCPAGDDGPLTVRARVRDKDGGEREYTAEVTVANVAPAIAAVTSSGPVLEGGSATITVSASDPVDALAYAFDCDGDGSYEVGPQAAGSATCAFPDNGSVEVRVRVTDGDGGAATASVTVPVGSVAPTGTLGSAGPVAEGSPATVGFSGVVDPSSADVAAGLHYAFACDGGLLDGTTWADSGTAPSTTCAFAENGSYPVRARVIDKDGAFTEYTTTVTVENVAPAVLVSLSASPIDENGEVTLTGSFTDPGSQDTHTVTIDWGDGTAATVLGLAAGELGFSATQRYLDDTGAGYTVQVSVVDDDAGAGGASASLLVRNVAPAGITLSLAEGAIAEGGSVALTASFADPGTQDGHTVTIDWGDGSTPTILALAAGELSVAAAHPYGDNPVAPATTFPVTVTVADDDGGTASVGTAVTVANAAPTATLSLPPTVVEGDAFTLALTGAADVPADLATLQYAFDCGAGYGAYGPAASASCAAADNGTLPVRGTVRDKDGAQTEYAATVAVTNVAPTASLTNGGPGSPGSPVTVAFVGAWDPSNADLAAGLRYAFACDGGPLAGATWGASWSAASTTCTFPAAGDHTVRGRVLDKDGGFGEYTTVISVVDPNGPPVITAITGPPGPVMLGAPATVTAAFSDAGAHVCTFAWDDGSATSVLAAGAGPSSCTATRVYAAPGVYTVGVTVIDEGGLGATGSFDYVVVYDPSAGFVTGGGWITTPPGKARFGFVAKYQKGASVPVGQTELQVPGLSFRSTGYEWLVVTGAQAQYTGFGTVNGAGDYGFLLTVTDGQQPGGDGVDRFRIKVWDRQSGGAVVYDNVPGAPDDLDGAAPQAMGGGSIVIHH